MVLAVWIKWVTSVPIDRKDKEAPWHKEFKKNQRRILINLHVLHPALRQCLSICKDHLNTTTMANCDGFRGDAIDLDSFCGNLIRWFWLLYQWPNSKLYNLVVFYYFSLAYISKSDFLFSFFVCSLFPFKPF